MESLSNDVPVTYRRAASFCVSRMLDPEFVHNQLVSSLLSPIIHHPFFHPSTPSQLGSQSATAPPNPTTALSMLTILLLNTDPSPVFITYVLSPVVSALYALMVHLDTTKASDPVLKESVRGLLATWGRVVEIQDCIDTLWSVIQGEQIYWDVDISGNIKRGAPVYVGIFSVLPLCITLAGPRSQPFFLQKTLTWQTTFWASTQIPHISCNTSGRSTALTWPRIYSSGYSRFTIQWMLSKMPIRRGAQILRASIHRLILC
jgi:hypothetical protein